jgi:transcriptional regulator with XRE-family HTH domain
MDLTGNHLKAARALAELDQETLAKMAGVSVNTIRNMEAAGRGQIGGWASTRDKVQACLEASGIEFTNGSQPGVRLRKGASVPAGESVRASRHHHPTRPRKKTTPRPPVRRRKR